MNNLTPADSAVQTRYMVLPKDANGHGTVFGGTILSWIDMIAAMAAERHCKRQVVTASIDSVSFHTPINLDDHVVLKACVNYVGKSSMEVGVRVEKENPHTQQVKKATTAYVTLVAVDENHKPVKINTINPQSDDEKRRYQQAKDRAKLRKQRRDNTTV